MSNGEQNDVPGGYFVGRPTNHAAEKAEEAQAAAEEKPVTTETPGGYFVGRPGSQHNQQQQKQEQVPEQNTKQSTPSFLAKCCPCLAGGGAAD